MALVARRKRCDAGAGASAGGQVAGHGEGLGRKRDAVRPQSHHSVEEAPLGPVDAVGVVGEDGLQGVGHALVGGAQGRQGCGFPEDDLRALAAVVMGGSPAAGFRR